MRTFAPVHAIGDCVELVCSNSFWPRKGHEFSIEYIQLLRECFDAEVIPLDYTKPIAENVAAMNAWINETTKGKIEGIMTESAVKHAFFTIINTIYFNGSWEKKFDGANTKKENFTVSQDKVVEVPMMHVERGYYALADFTSCQVLRIPYAGEQFYLTIALPRESERIENVEAMLNGSIYDQWNHRMKSYSNVDLKIPRFKIESETLDLIPLLQNLGINQVFQWPGADLSKMDGTTDLFVGQSLHKALIEVDEEGTKAAAVTTITGYSGASGYQPDRTPMVFHANRPFLFFIQEARSETILFMGKVLDPTK
jgi:serpin B